MGYFGTNIKQMRPETESLFELWHAQMGEYLISGCGKENAQTSLYTQSISLTILSCDKCSKISTSLFKIFSWTSYKHEWRVTSHRTPQAAELLLNA